MMSSKKAIFIGTALVLFSFLVNGQNAATVKEYKKIFRTYPFSDPDPIPEMGKVYPYYRFDGYTDKPVNKEWKVVELENDFIKVMILPEVGGKIWAAIEKTTNKSFIYYNQVVKFRDVAMRGPWTSGGLEPNYGIVGHTPNCATPVDYTIIKKEDGSVSCVIGVLDLLTRSTWRVDINLQKDKAYFTTSSTWYNGSPFEQPYYHWMNGALRAADDLQFVFPGTKYIGHGGEYADWPIDSKNRDLSFYRNNNFGSYKSYHVFGKHSNFWGGYYHDEDFGMARYSTYDDKAGKKIWIWGLSREGMIWEKLLTDTDGQYVEVQSGRIFNQPGEGSSLTPFKNTGFTPHSTDKWTEYWFPVLKTKGFVAASDFGSINIKKRNGNLVIYFSPVQPVNDELKITDGGKVIYSKKLNLKTLQLFSDSTKLESDGQNIQVSLGDNKLSYNASPDAGNLSRPVQSPAGFDWNSVQGLHIQGKEFIRQRMYTPAEEKLKAALKVDPNYLPALADMSLLMFRQMNYATALEAAKKALSIDTYDPAANYYYGLINEKTSRITDAKDGYAIAALSTQYRSAAYTRLSTIHFGEKDFAKAKHYALKSIEANVASLDAYQLLALMYRKQDNREQALKILDTLTIIDPLNHFANFERYLWDNNDKNKEGFTGMIRNEMPGQTFLELATWYHNAGLNEDAARVLKLATPDAEIACWLAYLENKQPDAAQLKPGLTFPFRHETANVLQELIKTNDHWLLKYYLALIKWNSNDIAGAKQLIEQCGELPGYAPFYAARAKLYMDADSVRALSDLQKAKSLDEGQWRYDKSLISYYLNNNQPAKALNAAAQAYKKSSSNYVIGMLYARALMQNKQYAAADKLLQQLNVLPNEGATGGRQLYREAKLRLAATSMRSGNCKKALQFIDDAKKWPESLGSGKPYQDDIDERLEDWMTYHCLLKTKDTKAAALLRKMAQDVTKAETRYPSINNLVTTWAMEKAGNKEDARQLLKKIVDKHPDNATAKWVLSTFNGENIEMPGQVKSNDNYEILKEAGLIK